MLITVPWVDEEETLLLHQVLQELSSSEWGLALPSSEVPESHQWGRREGEDKEVSMENGARHFACISLFRIQ